MTVTVAPAEEDDEAESLPLHPLWHPAAQCASVFPQKPSELSHTVSSAAPLSLSLSSHGKRTHLQHGPYPNTPNCTKSSGPAAELQMELLKLLPHRPSQRGLVPSPAQLQAGLPRVVLAVMLVPQLPYSGWQPPPQ